MPSLGRSGRKLRGDRGLSTEKTSEFSTDLIGDSEPECLRCGPRHSYFDFDCSRLLNLRVDDGPYSHPSSSRKDSVINVDNMTMSIHGNKLSSLVGAAMDHNSS